MFFSNLKDEYQNKTLPQILKKCIDYVNNNYNEIKNREKGVYSIKDNIKMILNEYETHNGENAIYETHLENIDIQIILSGYEYIAFNNKNYMTVDKIDKENDLIIYSGNPMCRLLLKEGDIAIFYKEDVHMVGLKESSDSQPEKVKKIVFKVPFELV